MAVSCFTGSTSSSTAGEACREGTSTGGLNKEEGGAGIGSALSFFFLPNGNRICQRITQ
jgi:hypothetical protein